MLVPRERLPDLGYPEADIQQVLESHAVVLNEEDLEQMTALSEPEDEDADAGYQSSEERPPDGE
jgi:sugar/nucleoside kinase (ribokinase family)